MSEKMLVELRVSIEQLHRDVLVTMTESRLDAAAKKRLRGIAEGLVEVLNDLQSTRQLKTDLTDRLNTLFRTLMKILI